MSVFVRVCARACVSVYVRVRACARACVRSHPSLVGIQRAGGRVGGRVVGFARRQTTCSTLLRPVATVAALFGVHRGSIWAQAWALPSLFGHHGGLQDASHGLLLLGLRARERERERERGRGGMGMGRGQMERQGG